MQDLYMMCSATRVRVGSFGRSMYKELCSFIASVVGIEPPHPILRSRTPHRLPIPRRIRCRPSYHTRPPPRRLPAKRLLPPPPPSAAFPQPATDMSLILFSALRCVFPPGGATTHTLSHHISLSRSAGVAPGLVCRILPSALAASYLMIVDCLPD